MDKKLIFNTIRKAQKSAKDILIPELCRGLRVLDVGCVGQDYDYNNPRWLHNQIKNSAASVDGADIESEGINKLRELGFCIYSPVELKSSGKQYDVIVMADVIEHVNDPVELLKFYSSFLAEKGRIIVTTPNAHGIRNFTSILVRNNYPLNPQHTLWLCPKTFMEIAERAHLNFTGFYWLKEYYKISEVKGLKYKLIYLFNRLFEKLRSNFYPNFMFIVSK